MDRPAHRLAAAGATAAFLLALALLLTSFRPAHAMKIQTVKSPGGIEAWLVEERSVPLMALRFAFEGGSSQDPAGREGIASFMAALMDEGAGDLDALAFQTRMEELAVRLSFDAGRDSLYGSFETLTVNREKGLALLKLALTKPRFDQDAVERIRAQLISNLAFAAKSPDRVADKAWHAAAFPGHPYGRPTSGTLESIRAIQPADLHAFRKANFGRDTLKVVAVGDIDAKTLAGILDELFAGLPAKAELAAVPATALKAGGRLEVIEMDVPQSVAVFGLGAMARKDPDFMAAFVLNQILGGGGFASRLMEEVREKRGLAYSVYSYLSPWRHASIFAGGVATKNDAMSQSLDVVRGELMRMAGEGPTETELANAKSYLTGSYALRFDTSSKIANQLLAISQEGLGIGYVDERNKQIEAVSLADVKRVAGRLLKADDLIVTVVGKPKGLASRM